MRNVFATICAVAVLGIPPVAAESPSENTDLFPPGLNGDAGRPAAPGPGLTDRDGDGISDGLQAQLADMAPGEPVDVVVTLTGPGTAAVAQAAVGAFAVHVEFTLIDGFAATMSAV